MSVPCTGLCLAKDGLASFILQISLFFLLLEQDTNVPLDTHHKDGNRHNP